MRSFALLSRLSPMEHNAVQIKIKPQVYIFFVLLLLLIPLNWLIGWSIAVIVHELCHICAVYFMGGRIDGISVGVNGICINSAPLSDGKRLFAILCGPIGGLLPTLLSSRFPRLAICCWVLSVYNLLPFLPLDGGRALKILIKNERYFIFLERFFLGVLTALALYGTFFLDLGILPLLAVGLFWLRNRKFPCK